MGSMAIAIGQSTFWHAVAYSSGHTTFYAMYTWWPATWKPETSRNLTLVREKSEKLWFACDELPQL